MCKLYCIAISGHMFYMVGELTDENIGELDTMAASMKCDSAGADGCEGTCRELLKHAKEKLGIQLELVPVRHVFRIKN